MNEAEVRRLIKERNKGDKFEAIYGPVKIAGSVIWEVWVAFEDEWMARFVEEPETGPVKIYDTFQQLAIRLNDRHLELMERLRVAEQAKIFDQTRQQSELALKAADSAAKRMTALIRDISTVAAFAISLLAFVYMLGPNDGSSRNGVRSVRTLDVARGGLSPRIRPARSWYA